MKSLLLWDIDGTLVNADGAGKRAFLRAMRDCFGVEATFDGFEMAGHTDRHILEWLLSSNGLERSEENFKFCAARCVECLEREMPRGGIHTYDGVESVLEKADKLPDVIQGVLTGNLRAAARLKLETFALTRYFSFGAYGEDDADRNALGPIALKRAREKHGQDFKPERVFVIGDTVRDIACGKAMGARTIAVATGFHSKEKLAAADPTLLLADLRDSEALFALIQAV